MTNLERLEVVDSILSRIAWLRSKEGLAWMERTHMDAPFPIMRTIIVMCFTESVERGIAPFGDMMEYVVEAVGGRGFDGRDYQMRRPYRNKDWGY